jgi:sensor histidine kinase YesM
MQPWYKNKWVNIFLHGAFWLLFFLLPYLLHPSYQDDEPQRRRFPQNDSIRFNLLKCLFWMMLFYLNAYILIPRLVYRKKYLIYVLCAFVLLGLLCLFEFAYFFMANNQGNVFHVRNFILFNLFSFLFLLAGSTTYRMFADKNREEQRTREKLAENLKSELSFLRSQMSPHFMFNVINNIIALARKKSDLVEPSLIKLSSLMRYFLYEHEHDKVPLGKEIEYLQSYIDLQQQRFSRTIVHLDVQRIDGAYEIEPMLLIPFVENAFKHGIVQNGAIDIVLEAKQGMLHFSVVNQFSEEAGLIKDKTSGIGLANVQRRLDLLYDKRHVLMISKRDGWFRVSLELKLH